MRFSCPFRSVLTVALSSCLAAAFLFAGPAHASSDWRAFSTPGGQAPVPLQLRDLNGKAISLDALKGQVVLLNFWATWCEPCREEIPALNRLQQKYAKSGLRIVGVDIGEGVPRIHQFTAQIPIQYTLWRDEDSAATKSWRVKVLPASFLIDRNGMLRYQLVGDAKWDDAGPQGPIEELLK